jgi:hypothetical protein
LELTSCAAVFVYYLDFGQTFCAVFMVVQHLCHSCTQQCT